MKKQLNETLEKYIHKLYKIQIESEQKLTKETLKTVAQDVGLTERELKELDEEALRHIERANSFMLIENYENAEKEFDEGLALNPLNEEYILKKAGLHLKWYHATSNKKHLKKAEELAKKCLDITPDYRPAILFIKEINNNEKRKRRKRRIKIISLIVVISVVVLATLFVLLEEGYFIQAHGLEGQKYNIDAVIEDDAEVDGVVFDFSKVAIEHNDYQGSPYFDLIISGKITANNIEVRELSMKGEYLDKNNEVVCSEVFWFVSNDDFILRPGDCRYINQNNFWSVSSFATESDVRRIKRLVFKQKTVTTYSPASFYPEAKQTDFDWITEKPPHLEFEIGVRKNNVRVLHESDRSMVQDLVLQVKNTGTEYCRELILNIAWYDSEKNEIENKDFKIVDMDAPVLERNEMMVCNIDEYFYEGEWDYPVPFSSYKIRIRSVK